jgi:hypothetical protein
MDDFPAHIKNIIKNREEIETLLNIHSQIAGRSPGKKHKVEVLNKSAITLLVACWEAYVEDLADTAFNFLIKNSKKPTDVPKRVLARAAKGLITDKDETKIWDLADSGWRKVLEQHKEQVKNRYIGKLNTPRPKQIDELFENMIGIKGLSKNWRWKGASNSNVVKRLDDLITLRGEIAHRVSTSNSVRKLEVVNNLQFIGYLSVKLSNQVGLYLTKTTKNNPWIPMQYGSVS